MARKPAARPETEEQTTEIVSAPRAWQGEQSWWFQGTWRTAGVVVRVSIRRNAYDEQSWARAEIFSPAALAWNLVASRTIKECRCKGVSYLQATVSAVDFSADAAALVDEVRRVVVAAR